jgi:tocopherol O-methyltransferase
MASRGGSGSSDSSIIAYSDKLVPRSSCKSDQPASDPVVAYYERKTESILRRYGPGPRVHFHTGFVDQPTVQETYAKLHRELHESQERMLRDATDAWDWQEIAFREVLDVGCGLGGTAIFCAQEFGSHVTAITIAPSHVPLVAGFSAQAEVSSQVHPLLCDALEMPGKDRFDAIIAIDSSSCLSRRPWFRRVMELLRPGGRLFVADCFLEKEVYREPFDQHWCARIGTVEEYLAAAQAAGLKSERCEEVSRLAANFWGTTMALICLEAQAAPAGDAESLKWRESLRVHSLMREGLLDGGLRHLMMSFAKP